MWFDLSGLQPTAGSADKGEVVGLQVGLVCRGRVADTQGEGRGRAGFALLACGALSWAKIQYEECLDLLIALTARVGFGENLRSEGT